MKTIQFIKTYLEKDYIKLIGAIFASLADAFFTLLGPLIFSFFIDYVLSSEIGTDPILLNLLNILGGQEYLQQNLWIGGLLIVGLHIFISAMPFIKGYLNAQVSENFSCRLRNAVYQHIQKLPFSAHSDMKTGDIVQRCTSDIDQIRRALSSQLTEIFYSVALALIAGGVLFSINLKLGIIAVVVIPLVVFYGYNFFKNTQKAFLKSDEAEGELTTLVQESLSGIRVIKAFNRELYEIERFEKKNKEYRDVTFNMIRILGKYWSTGDFLCTSQIAIVVILGIVFVVNGEISIGNLFVFISYETSILWPIRNIGRIVADLGKAEVSVGRIQEILDIEQEDLHSGKVIQFQGKIQFDNVGFEYEKAQTKTLEKISFTLNKGETLAVLGPTGAGKSTLIHLLSRLHDYTEGSIKLDGEELKDLQKESVRKQIGLVMQEPFLFSKSIFENIQLAQKNTEEGDIHQAAKIASVHDVISSFDQGYKTLVGEKGVTLSGGQKQRVAIARTLLMKTPILVFDDSLSAVDTETDKVIRAALSELDYNPTKIIITQRISSTINADKIIVLENGRITQMGVHSQLVEEEGLYKRIYDIQKIKIENRGDKNE